MKLDHIDTCRGIAILMVILVHVGQTVPDKNALIQCISSYGQMGVQLFFVASAYTLCISWNLKKDGNWPVYNFFTRRFFRIAPLYWIGIALYAIVTIVESWFRLGEAALPSHYSIVNVLSNVLLAHGFYPPANNNIVPGGWSIGTEVAFYVLFPALAPFIISKCTSIVKGLAIAITWMLTVQATLYIVYQLTGKYTENSNFIYFNILVQSQVFLLGIVFYKWNTSGFFKHFNTKLLFILFLVFTAASCGIWGIERFTDSGHLFSIIPVVSAFSFVFLFLILERLPVLNISMIRHIGKVSFSMYIVHFIFAYKVGALASPILTGYVGSDLTLLTLFLTSTVCSYLLARLSYRYLETVFIDFGKRFLVDNKVAHQRDASKPTSPLNQ